MKQQLLRHRINEAVDSVPIANGGTAARTKKTACKNLGLVSQDQVKQPDGIIILGEDGFIQRGDLPPDLINIAIPSLFGPEEVNLGGSIDIYITNYSADAEYVISAEGGTVVREVDRLTFTGGMAIMEGKVIVNGKPFDIYVGPPRPLTPSILEPSGPILLNMGPGAFFTSSAFIAGQPGDTHLSTDWQVSTDPDFVVLTMRKDAATGQELTDWNVMTFTRDTQYYARVRYRGAGQGISQWSEPLALKTRYAFVPKRLTDTMVPLDIMQGDNFGTAVAADIHGTRFLVGSPSDDINNGQDAGSIYVFDHLGAINTQRLKLTTVESGQSIDIYIPVGGSLTIQFDTVGSVPVVHTVSQAIVVPDGATMVSMIGHGGAGHTTTTAAIGNPSYPSGLPPYSPGQSYIAPQPYGWIDSWFVDGTGWSTPAGYELVASTASGMQPQYIPTTAGIRTGNWTADDTYRRISDGYTYTSHHSGPFVSVFINYQGRPYIAPTGNVSYPSGLPAYVPAGTYPFYGESAFATIGGTIYEFLGGLGDPTIVGQGNISYPNGLPPYSAGQLYVATVYDLRWQLTSAATNIEGAVNELTLDPLYPVRSRPVPGSAPTAVGQMVDAGGWSQWDAVAGPLGSPVPGWRNYSTSIYLSYSYVIQGQDYIPQIGNPSYPAGLPPYIPAGTTTIPSTSLTAYLNANHRFGYSVAMSDDGLYVAGGALTSNPRSRTTQLNIALGGSMTITSDSSALVSNTYSASEALNIPGDATTVTFSGKGASGSGASPISELDLILTGNGSLSIDPGVPALTLTGKGSDGVTFTARKWIAVASVATPGADSANGSIKAYYLADDGVYCVTKTPNTISSYGQLPGNKLWVNIETAQPDVLNVALPGSGTSWVIATAADGSRVLISDLTIVDLPAASYHELPALPAGKVWSKIFRLPFGGVCAAVSTDGFVVYTDSDLSASWAYLPDSLPVGKTWVAVTGASYTSLYALSSDGAVQYFNSAIWQSATLPGNDPALFSGTNVWKDMSMGYLSYNGSYYYYEALTTTGVSSIHGALQARSAPLIYNGTASTFTINGQTYTCPGGVGVPATEQTFEVMLPGGIAHLNYNIATGGTGHAAHPYVVPPFIIGESTTVTVAGQTYTFPGGQGCPASTTTYTVGFEETKNAGSVVLSNFSNDVWNAPTKLLPDTNTAELKFGFAMDFDRTGLRLAVGAPGHSNLAGAVYVYIRENGNWTIESIIKPSDSQIGDYFGSSLSLSSDGDVLVVGARNKLSNTGAVYIYERTGTSWAQQAELYHSAPGMNQFFGHSVDITGNGEMIIVGIPGLTVSNQTDVGAAAIYVKETTGWVQTSLLLAVNYAAGDRAGTWVSIDEQGVIAVVGSPYADYNGTANTGAIYTYANYGRMWAEDTTLGLYAQADGDQLGNVVALTKNGELLFTGAPGYDHSNITNSGAVIIYNQL